MYTFFLTSILLIDQGLFNLLIISSSINSEQVYIHTESQIRYVGFETRGWKAPPLNYNKYISKVVNMKQTYQMFFGLNTPTGTISEDAWDAFRDVISMSFAGYTIQDCEGAWKGSQESTKLVTVTTKYRDKIIDVCDAYMKTFDQDAVGLLITNPMRFVTKVSEVY